MTTDRRAYHIHLKAVADRYMARTAFDYAADPQALLRALAPDPAPVMAAFTPEPVVEYVATEPGFASAADLDFDYEVDGRARWRPLRVYNDGVRTYIDMPASVSSASLPAFQVEGGDGDAALVNYRFRDGRFVVDQLFDRGFLTLGVGKRREEVRMGLLAAIMGPAAGLRHAGAVANCAHRVGRRNPAAGGPGRRHRDRDHGHADRG